MQHVDCLLSRRVVRVFEAKFLNDSTSLNIVCVEIEKLRYCRRLLRCEQTLTQLDLA